MAFFFADACSKDCAGARAARRKTNTVAWAILPNLVMERMVKNRAYHFAWISHHEKKNPRTIFSNRFRLATIKVNQRALQEPGLGGQNKCRQVSDVLGF